jgi:hypothetical protein
MEEAYIKEGEDIWIKGDWVKTKTIYDNNKLNKEIPEYTPSFRKVISDDMNRVISEYYIDAMKDIVVTYKMKRKREEREKKKQKEKEKQMNMVKKNEEEKTIEKIEVKKSNLTISKEADEAQRMDISKEEEPIETQIQFNKQME